MQGIRWQFRAAAILLAAAVRSLAEYRLDMLFTVLSGAFYQCTGFLTVWVILSRFDSVAGWNLKDVAFLYGMRLCAHAIWVVPFSQLAFLSDHIQQGTFDRFLLRPVNPLIQLMTTRVRFNTLGDVLGGITIFSVALSISDIDFTVGKVIFLCVSLVSGAALECGVQLAMSSLSFRAVKADELRFVADWVFSLYGNYPAKMFGKAGQWVLATVIPVAFVAYLPASVLLDRTHETGLPPIMAYLSPVVGVAALLAGYRMWRHQLRHYQSAGN